MWLRKELEPWVVRDNGGRAEGSEPVTAILVAAANSYVLPDR
jgi:hypothetical protein